MIVKEKSEKSSKTPSVKEKSEASSKKTSKKQKKMAANVDLKCPICCENLGLDEHCFYPCKCGYQICSFCWHRIKTNENCLCPACRRPYSEDPVNYKPLSQEEIQKAKNEKKMKDIQKKKEIAESRKQFANIRVVQKNLIYVHGLPLEIDLDDNKLNKLQKMFKEFGPITKCVINNKTNYAGSQTPKASAYVTYQKIEDALKAYKKLPNTRIEGHDVKTSLGTTKYCSNFLKNVHCPKQDCMYLHDMADEELCFTKEQIHAGEHLKCGDMLYERMILHNQQRMMQYSQPKEPVQSEKATTPEAPSPKEETITTTTTHVNCEESRSSPVQSRLQQYLSKSESQSSIHEDEFHGHFNGQPEPHLFVETSRSDVLNSEPERVHRSCLSSEEAYVNNSCPPVNNSHNGIIKPFQNFPPPHSNPQDVHNGDLWQEQRSTLLGSYGNASQPMPQQNVFLYDTRSTSAAENAKSSIFNRLPYTNHGTNSLSENFESRTEQYDDDLGFDPCQVSLKGLQDLIQAEPKVNTTPTIQRYGRNPHLPSQTPKQQIDLHSQEQEHHQLLRLRLAQQQMLRLKNPPPGFSLNSFPSNHPPPSSPVYESRNPTIPSRMSPIMNVSNSFNSMRGGGGGGGANNYPIPRITPGAGISHNTNTIVNGFSPQTARIPPQSMQMHDFLSRSTQQNAQRYENLSQPQFPAVEQPNLSPSFWNNINQSQWMPAENSFQNQGMPVDCRPGSPLLNIRRMQQMRQNEYNRHIQQMTARVNNMSFADAPQYLFPNSQQQQQQQQQGVHTFP